MCLKYAHSLKKKKSCTVMISRCLLVSAQVAQKSLEKHSRDFFSFKKKMNEWMNEQVRETCQSCFLQKKWIATWEVKMTDPVTTAVAR